MSLTHFLMFTAGMLVAYGHFYPWFGYCGWALAILCAILHHVQSTRAKP